MAGKLRYWKEKNGRFYARIAVPAPLRPFLDQPRSELIEALGSDRRAAIRLHPAAVARLQHLLALAERKSSSGKTVSPEGRFPMTPAQLAATLYAQRLELDEWLRNDSRYAAIGVDDQLVQNLRDGISGKLGDQALMELVGSHIERFRNAGNLSAKRETVEWRQIARALCVAEYEALARVVERDEADFDGKPDHPLLANAVLPEASPSQVSISKLWDDYLTSRTQAGFSKDGGKRQEPVIKNLKAFLKHNDAQRVTKKTLLAWRDHLLAVNNLSAKTVNDIYLSTIRSLFAWAHDNERLAENVAASVKQPKPRRVQNRERGYTDFEALTVLKASRSHVPKPNQFGFVRETPHMTAALLHKSREGFTS